jgi:hypothetical protein
MNHKEQSEVIAALSDPRTVSITKERASIIGDGSYGISYLVENLDGSSYRIARTSGMMDQLTGSMYERIRGSHAEQAAKEAARDAELAAAQAKLDAVRARADEAAARAKWDRAETIPVELPEAFKRLAEAAKAMIEAMAAVKEGK